MAVCLAPGHCYLQPAAAIAAGSHQCVGEGSSHSVVAAPQGIGSLLNATAVQTNHLAGGYTETRCSKQPRCAAFLAAAQLAAGNLPSPCGGCSTARPCWTQLHCSFGQRAQPGVLPVPQRLQPQAGGGLWCGCGCCWLRQAGHSMMALLFDKGAGGVLPLLLLLAWMHQPLVLLHDTALASSQLQQLQKQHHQGRQPACGVAPWPMRKCAGLHC